eukprot:858662_1
MSSLASVKLVLLGNASVGKSSILQRFASDVYSEHKPPTVGAAFTTKVITVNNRQIKFDIWDTAGQEKYRSMTPLYYRGAYAAIIVYDITDDESYIGAQSWINEIRQIEGDKIKIALVGNKLDLQDSSRAIDTETAFNYADNNNFIFMETSAKTGIGIKELFQQIGKSIPLNINMQSNKSDLSSSQIEFIRDDDNFTNTSAKKKLCC